jgi:hypothetical protein
VELTCVFRFCHTLFVQDGLSVVSIWTVREEAYSPRVRLVLDHLRFDLLGARFLWQVV